MATGKKAPSAGKRDSQRQKKILSCLQTEKKKKSSSAKKRSQSKRHNKSGFGIALLLFTLICLGIFLLPRLIGREAAEPQIPGLPEEPETEYPYEITCFHRRNGRTYYDDADYICETGIDVSSYQGEIDWYAAAEDGIQFAILRAGYRGYTSGELQADDCFLTNLAGARDAGLQIGVYFFSQAITEEEAREEARFALEQLGGASLDLPIYCDWEFTEADESRTAGASGETISRCCRAFCEEIAAGGYTGGVYLSSYLLDSMVDLDLLVDLPVWMAEYSSCPTCLAHYEIWQYSCTGMVDGISTPVDLNLRFIPAA